MINKINYAFVGETFIDWVRSNYCIEAQDREFFPLFKKAIERSGATISRVGLGNNNWDTASLFSILEKNKDTITYARVLPRILTISARIVFITSLVSRLLPTSVSLRFVPKGLVVRLSTFLRNTMTAIYRPKRCLIILEISLLRR